MSKQFEIKQFFGKSKSSKLNKPNIEIEIIEEVPIVDLYTTIR